MDKIAIFACYAIGANLGWAAMTKLLDALDRRKRQRDLKVPYRWID